MSAPTIALPVPPPGPSWVDDVVVRRAVALALGQASPAPGRPLTIAEIEEGKKALARTGVHPNSVRKQGVAWRVETRRFCRHCGLDFAVVAVQRVHDERTGLFVCRACPGGAR